MRKTVLFVMALALACATLALAQQPPTTPPGPGGPGGPGGGGMSGMRGGMMMSCPAMTLAPPQNAMIDRNADTLALKDDQKTKLTGSLTKSEGVLQTYRQKSADAAKALRDALLAPTFDAAKVQQLLADAQKIEAAIAASELQTWGEIRSILTTDQVTKLSDAMSRRMGGYGGAGANTGTRGSRGNRGNRGGPPAGGPPAGTPPPPDAPAPDAGAGQ